MAEPGSKGNQEAYTRDIYSSIDTADLDAWLTVQGRTGDPFTDPRFLRTVELSMARYCQLWHLIIRDGSGNPVACASLSTFRVDLTVVASRHAKRLVEGLRKAVPSLLRLKVVFCGIPVSAGQCSLVMSPTADHALVLALIDQTMIDIAIRERALLLCYKELGHGHQRWLEALVARGYLCSQTPPMHYFPFHRDFPAYLSSLRSHYRYDIRRSMRKAERAGVGILRLKDPDVIQQRYRVELHELYVRVVNHSSHQLESLPVEFFHELVRQFPGQVGLTVATIQNHVVAFNWSLHTASAYYLLFCGIDYQANTEADLYFNLMYAELAQALRVGATDIQVGQTADVFKARIGCEPRPRYICVKSRYRIGTWLIKVCGDFLFPSLPPTPKYDIYRTPQ
jgi:predicted N-acyltransferase